MMPPATARSKGGIDVFSSCTSSVAVSKSASSSGAAKSQPSESSAYASPSKSQPPLSSSSFTSFFLFLPELEAAAVVVLAVCVWTVLGAEAVVFLAAGVRVARAREAARPLLSIEKVGFWTI